MTLSAFGLPLLYGGQPPDFFVRALSRFRRKQGITYNQITTLHICNHIFAPDKLGLLQPRTRFPSEFKINYINILIFLQSLIIIFMQIHHIRVRQRNRNRVCFVRNFGLRSRQQYLYHLVNCRFICMPCPSQCLFYLVRFVFK